MYYPRSKNKGADQLCSNCEADLFLCFRLYAEIQFSHDAAHIPLKFQRTTIVTGNYEPNDEEADWPSDKEDEDELSVSVSFTLYPHCYHGNSP